MIELARAIVERNLGADFIPDEEPTPDAIFDDAFTLAVDALIDAGVERSEAQRVARGVAMMFAQT